MAKRELERSMAISAISDAMRKAVLPPNKSTSAAPWHKTAGEKLRQKSKADKGIAAIDAPPS